MRRNNALGNLCKSDTEITNALNSTALQMGMVNTYYDFDDYEEPVKTYFNNQFYYNFVSDFEKKMDIFVRQNSVEQKDSIYRYTAKGDESNFISKRQTKVCRICSTRTMNFNFHTVRVYSLNQIFKLKLGSGFWRFVTWVLIAFQTVREKFRKSYAGEYSMTLRL